MRLKVRHEKDSSTNSMKQSTSTIRKRDQTSRLHSYQLPQRSNLQLPQRKKPGRGRATDMQRCHGICTPQICGNMKIFNRKIVFLKALLTLLVIQSKFANVESESVQKISALPIKRGSDGKRQNSLRKERWISFIQEAWLDLRLPLHI